MKNVTPIPNTLFDKYLCQLKPSETVVLLVIMRQTLGWIDRDGGRKKRDWITNTQFQYRTSLSDKTISSAIDKLVKRHLIKVTDFYGNVLETSSQRRGKLRIFYELQYKPIVKTPSQ